MVLMSQGALPPAPRSCAGCTEQIDAKLCCARCHTLYCSRPCQKAHWNSGGHKQACAGIARARRDTDLEAQLRALSYVSHMSGGAPDDARCLFCLDGGDAAEPLVRGCACRGSYGWAHAACLIRMTEAARAPLPGEPTFTAWVCCSTCKQRFTGQVQLRLAVVLWARHARAVETDEERLCAAFEYSTALQDAGEHAEAARLQRGVLDVRTRMLGPEHCVTLACATNLARSLLLIGEHVEAAALLRTTLAARTRTAGPDDAGTLALETNLASALNRLKEYAEAEALGRSMLEKMRRVLGPGHRDTLAGSANLAISLSEQGKHAKATEIQREVLASTTHLLGAEHEDTLLSAGNLAVLLAHCGLETEAEQLIRDTLAVSRRVLGPTHEQTQRLVGSLRTLHLRRNVFSSMYACLAVLFVGLAYLFAR